MKYTREDIADTLSTVPGVTGYAVPPAGGQPGDAWPEWTSTRFVSMTNFEATFDVYLILTNSHLPETVNAADPMIEAVAWALATVAVVEAVEPTSIITEAHGNAVPALRFTIST